MHNKADKEFDSYIKSIMEDAMEQAPAGIWDAIESRLPQPRRSPVVWWRAAGIGLAAAAVALGAFFFIRPSGKDAIPSTDVSSSNYVAVVPGDGNNSASAPLMASNTLSDEVAAAPAAAAPAVRDVPAVSDSQAPVPVTVNASPSTEPAPAASKQDEPAVQEQSSEPEGIIEYKVNPFATAEEAHAKVRNTELQFNGLVGSNEPGQTAFHGRPVIMGAPTANNIPSLISETTESEYDIPLSFGVGVRFYLNDKLSLGTGASFTMMSRSFEGTYKGVPSADIRHSVKYVGIPVNVYYDLFNSDFIKVYSFVGGSAEKAISNSFVIKSAGEAFTYSEKVNGLQWSANLGLGVQFNLSNTIGLYLDPSARYYFDCNQPKSIRTKQPFMFGFEAGLRFDL